MVCIRIKLLKLSNKIDAIDYFNLEAVKERVKN
jgi:hypothetical protein